MNNKEYRICTNCVMDTSDSKITFDKDGVCDHCIDFHENVLPYWDTDINGKKQLESIISEIKKQGKKMHKK